MTIRETFNIYAIAAMDNTVELFNDIRHGTKSWIQNSDVTWISTAVTYYGTRFATDNEWIKGIDAKQAATCVALACSIYGFVQGFFADDSKKHTSISDLPNKSLILITNTIALALYGSHCLGHKLSAFQAVTLTVASYALVKMLHTLKYSSSEK